ncbi:MAG: cation:proton antiporter, partial [Actinobacteria bacterium]|nr:cation:proton antiporter [Actinomycetota bacterium]
GTPVALVVTVLVVVVASLGKLGGTAVAARAVGMTWSDSTGLGLLMNTRGLTEIVILAVGLQLGVINGSVYTAMVVMALITTFVASPVLEATGIAARWRAEVDAR